MGDARRLRQVLTNLVGNAISFTGTGKIEISTSYDTDQQVTRFAVLDTGAGIAEDAIDKVFDQFFQADSSTTRRHGGSGLGLAISKQLFSMMGGDRCRQQARRWKRIPLHDRRASSTSTVARTLGAARSSEQEPPRSCRGG